MRKHVLILFVCMALVISSVAPSVFAAQPVKLSLWTHQRHMMDLVQSLLDEFNKTVGAEKGIVVEMQVLADDASNVLLAASKK